MILFILLLTMNSDLQLFFILLSFPVFLFLWGFVRLFLEIRFLKTAKIAEGIIDSVNRARGYPHSLFYSFTVSFTDDNKCIRTFRTGLSAGLEKFAKMRVGRKCRIYYKDGKKFRAVLKNNLFINTFYLIVSGLFFSLLIYSVIFIF